MRLALPEGITRSLAKQVLIAKKNSPHIFFAAGITGAIGSTVLACRATLKLEETLDGIKMDIEKVKAADLEKTEHNRLVVLKIGRGVVKIGRLYGPSIVLGSASIAALAGSHAQLARRNTALTGALAMVTQALEEYRERVSEEIGEDKEREIYYGVGHEEMVLDGKKQLLPVRGPDGLTPFARVFDAANSYHWEKNPELNLIRIRAVEAYLNQRLNAYGYVFLNEAYSELGFERSSQGAIFGWIKADASEPTVYVSFGVEDYPANVHFLRGHDNSCFLDFNVTGVIYHLIDKVKEERGR